ncbi:TIGR04282 family arsenosugar biosynthesis glycosyltransferase [Microscilla marina]|uniref:Glycosyltransferase n=1 Tax=Microscilla marina ATCC 23134 TaxID=313606 RepID=A1ZZN8_MICM2|nr:TIGR04282 family arsenosugar biosynthesis glycosyltransferase [Microscilla marina]EAY24146.1 conserved hypothetical protein [Microscilla marina ATCC 23134]
MPHKNLLLIFTKNPIKGKVKTRLAQSVGETKALEVYQYLLQHTRKVTQCLDADKAVFYADFVASNDEWHHHDYQKFVQQGDDLGIRMGNAFRQGFAQGYQHIVIIGSDCAQITSEIITEAFVALTTHDVAIGPAKDGGYYLLGMNQLHAEVFQNKTWSTPTVLAQTRQDFENMQATIYTLPQLSDIDTAADLQTLPPNVVDF